ncbi:MAG: site-2 protease family protein [Candidatus Sumerlaeaceae bacterium]|nr:site-2 protease family protein [Candidatus Sumerlaeaceae bacterium]
MGNRRGRKIPAACTLFLTVKGNANVKWSVKLCEVAGIGIFVHITFLILLGFLGVSYYLEAQSLRAALMGVLYILSLFGSVLLHELGHALAAKRYKIHTRDITLLPIGGVARLERMPDKPIQELVVAIAGPMVNVVIATIIFVYLKATGQFREITEQILMSGTFLERLMITNVMLVIFNMLPAFPMDGGRVLRALLALKLEYSKATRIAAWIGQFMALLFGLFGMMTSNFILVFIAVFVWFGAGQEAGAAQMKSALGGTPVSQAMLTEFRAMYPDSTLGDACSHIIAGAQQDFPIIEGNHVVGILTRNDLIVGLAQKGQDAPISEAMRTDFITVEATELLDTVLAKLNESSLHTIPVLHHGDLVGLLTTENIGEYVMIQAALKGRHR